MMGIGIRVFPRSRWVVLGIALLFWAPGGAVPAAAESRASLAESISPYLRLHADDPVAWREWTPALLEEARQSGRPLLISSGYYACHWCHVMQEESFKDAGIAERLNRDYIPVKVDRELHGALDHYLLEFLRATRGSAGWPLNVVVLPTGDALAGVVYAPRDDFAAFLDRIAQRLRDDGEALAALAREARIELTARLREGEVRLSSARAARLPDALWAAMERDADFLAGGFGDQSKFPQVPALNALLLAMAQGRAPGWAGEFLAVTLDEMARAGLRDVIGGGFFRYSETPDWGRPHFEIMLEDQAQLARLYLRAGRQFDRADWTRIGRETLAFVARDMAIDSAAFASGLSAIDTAGREGGAYLWTPEQIDAALDRHPAPELVRAWFGFDGNPSFSTGFLPKEQDHPADLAERFGIPEATVLDYIDQGRAALLEHRRTRGLPRDEKPLTGLHGLLLSALAELPDDAAFGPLGAALAERLRGAARRPEALSQLLDVPSDVAGVAHLSDYATLGWGLHDWAEATGASDSVPLVVGLLETAWADFADADGWRPAREQPLPGMVAQRFHPAVHRPSATTRVLALSRIHADHSEFLERALTGFDLRPGRAIETAPREHAELILLLTEGGGTSASRSGE